MTESPFNLCLHRDEGCELVASRLNMFEHVWTCSPTCLNHQRQTWQSHDSCGMRCRCRRWGRSELGPTWRRWQALMLRKTMTPIGFPPSSRRMRSTGLRRTRWTHLSPKHTHTETTIYENEHLRTFEFIINIYTYTHKSIILHKGTRCITMHSPVPRWAVFETRVGLSLYYGIIHDYTVNYTNYTIVLRNHSPLWEILLTSQYNGTTGVLNTAQTFLVHEISKVSE